MSETDRESNSENVADKETIIKVLGILENVFNPSKFNSAKREIETAVKEFERDTGFKAPTYEENRQIYRDSLADDLKKLREPAIDELRSQLLENCEINPNWSFDKVDNSEANEGYTASPSASWVCSTPWAGCCTGVWGITACPSGFSAISEHKIPGSPSRGFDITWRSAPSSA